MRACLDACVLYPTVMREMLLGVAAAGLYTPVWSDRILEEWARAVARNLPEQAGIARAEIALVRARFPDACVEAPSDMGNLHLPDPDDIHVLGTAIAGRAGWLVTLNMQDFPTRTLSQHGILRRDPDGFLTDLWHDHPETVAQVAETVRARAETLSGDPRPMRALLKKAKLPRLGKTLG